MFKAYYQRSNNGNTDDKKSYIQDANWSSTTNNLVTTGVYSYENLL